MNGLFWVAVTDFWLICYTLKFKCYLPTLNFMFYCHLDPKNFLHWYFYTMLTMSLIV